MSGEFRRRSALSDWSHRGVDFRVGDRHALLRRHDRAAARAVRAGRRGLREIAPYLLRRVADARVLRTAWDYLRAEGGDAPGPDGKHNQDYDEHDVWGLLRAIGASIRAGTYRPDRAQPSDFKRPGSWLSDPGAA
jgi:hypothetical protein